MKKDYYLTLDTETATLPFVSTLCTSADDKKKIAIAKPLVYDIGWVITDRLGNAIKTVNYLVQETFFVPSVFNTAYYKDKRPIYMTMLADGKISTKCWNDIMEELIFDLSNVKMAMAYNACFDFKKAIPFTENYISHLYSVDYLTWESEQYDHCVDIINGKDTSINPNFLTPVFSLRGVDYPIADLWGVACEKLINENKYKKFCLDNSLLTNSALYFKTSAETSFQFLTKDNSFVEEHTALSDALIESEILTKALKRGKISPYIKEFPFKELGTTYDFVAEKKNSKYKSDVIDAIHDYYTDYVAKKGTNAWTSQLENILADLGY